MKKYKCWIMGKKRGIGITTRSIHILDGDGKVLSEIPSIKDAAMAALSPDEHWGAIKSRTGVLLILDLDDGKVCLRQHISRKYTQENGFCFSEDSQKLFNIENHESEFYADLVQYQLPDMNRNVVIKGTDGMHLQQIYYSRSRKTYYVYAIVHGCPDVEIVVQFNGVHLINEIRTDNQEGYNLFLRMLREENN